MTKFNEYIKSNKFIDESSLSRIYRQTLKHDAGTITAFRSARDCNDGKPFTKTENKNRNAKLKAKLLSLGYGVTAIDGTYIENYKTNDEREVKEDSYMVIDLKDSGNLKRDLIKLGQKYEQDSITFQDHKEGKYFLISSNSCPNGYPGSGKVGVKIKLGKTLFGKSGEFHSKVNGRPFVFENIKSPIRQLNEYYPTEIRSILNLAKQ